MLERQPWRSLLVIAWSSKTWNIQPFPVNGNLRRRPAAQAGVEWRKTHQIENAKLCTACVDVCPTGALQPTNLQQFHLGTARVYRENCLAWMHGTCSFPCIDACVFDAITLTTGPNVDATKCVGCNQCSYVCLARETGPTGIMVEPTPPVAM